MATPEYLAENEVTIPNLVQLFKRAFLKTSFDDDGDLFVNINSVPVYIYIDNGNKYLRFESIFRFKEADNLGLKYQMMNNLNDEWMMVRFRVPANSHTNLLLSDFHIPYEEGILPFQIIASIRLFAEIVPAAIQKADEHGLME